MAYASRMGNSGQACINAKRFIITAPVYDEFRDRLIEKIRSTAVIGDPMDLSVNVGPLALKRQKELLMKQIKMATTEARSPEKEMFLLKKWGSNRSQCHKQILV